MNAISSRHLDVSPKDVLGGGGHGLDSWYIYQRRVAQKCVEWGDTDSTVGVFISDVSPRNVLK